MSRQTSPSIQMQTPSQERPFAAERSEDSMEAKPRPSFARLGFWSAVLAFLFSNTFTIGAVVGFPKPWDIFIPIGASLLLAPSFVVMMVSVHYAAPSEKKIWSHIGMAFALLYAAMVEIVYVTWLFVVEPHVLRGQANQVALLIFTPGSFLQMVDGLGYTFMMIAVLFTAPVFSNRGFERWIRWTGIANGIFAIPVFLSYVYYSFILGLWWGITIPAFSLLLAVYFWRTGDTTRQSNTSSDRVVRSE
jgi:hypothetical protein